MRSTGGVKRLIKGSKSINRATVEVGIVDSFQYTSGGKTVDGAAVARKLDQGPVGKKGKKWPFMRRAVEEAKRDNRVKIAMRDAALGHGAAGLHRVGEVMSLKGKSLIRQSIKSPQLEPSTIARKGSTKPLIETGALMRGFGYKIK